MAQAHDTTAPLNEPSAERLADHPLRFLLATRPPFLLATAAPVALGWAYALHLGYPLDPLLAIATLLAALLLHGAINVINDYHDALNGTDEQNTGRLHPFTGGSRFIQNGILDLHQTRRLALTLFALAALIGLGLGLVTSPGLYLLGLGGVLIGWGYSAPPLALNSRGLGELAVALGFSLLPAGAFWVQSAALDSNALLIGLPGGLLTAALLYINQFPDRQADAQAGKRHWVVRLAPRQARWGYPLLLVLAYGGLLLLVVQSRLPPAALAGLLALPMSLFAAHQLLTHADNPSQLAPAIRLTIAALLALVLLQALGLALSTPS
ncbi:MAG: prenyltransferase [Pseudomonadota bacterium]